MPRIRIPTSLRRLVIERAQGKCEYCLLHKDDAEFPHEIDHLIAVKHGGLTVLENLAFACLKCNRYKGSDLTAVDPIDKILVPIFDPRTQIWSQHFTIAGAYLIGQTQTGRATSSLLKFNDPARVRLRFALIEVGRFLV